MLFDVGNVLIDIDHGIVSRRIVREYFPSHLQTGGQRELLHSFIFSAHEGPTRNARLDCGARDLNWLRESVCQEFGLTIPEPAFASIWLSIFADTINADAVDCLRRLQRDGFEVALCSNTNREHWEFLVSEHPQFAELAKELRGFLSFQIGREKSDPDFFRSVAKSTGAPREQHVLLDDVEPNCRAAEAARMHAVRFVLRARAASIQEILTFAKKRLDHSL